MASMPSSNALEALLHPERVLIAGEIAGRALTTGEIAAILPEISQTSLYRHLRVLADAGVIEVAQTAVKRGAVEKRYALRSATSGETSSAEKTRDQMLDFFGAVHGLMLAQFTRFVRSSAFATRAVEPLFRGYPVYATDAEYEQLVASLVEPLQNAFAQVPGNGRTRRYLFAVAIPTTEGAL
jgi:DNA-binding transcriptional ArsR family regulator